jgi:hypothetical protein
VFRRSGGVLVVSFLCIALLMGSVAVAKPIPRADANLVRMGFTVEQVASMRPEFRQHLVEKLGISWKLVGVSEKSGWSNADGPSALRLGGDDFGIRAYIFREAMPPAGQERFYAVSMWEWNSAPLWKLTDKVGLAWSGPLQADQNTLQSVYIAQDLGGGTTRITRTAPDEQTPGAGFGFDVDLLDIANGRTVTDHYGWIEGDLYKTYNSKEPHFGTVVTQYYHKQYCLVQVG